MATALQLMFIGMLTVFLILLLVVVIGNLIVRFVNKYVHESVIVQKSNNVELQAIEPRKMAAIVSAVQIVTNGRGKVVKVDKK
jgi:oxaloacetate decarboxylase (Na+ extruding) subunit gamma